MRIIISFIFTVFCFSLLFAEKIPTQCTFFTLESIQKRNAEKNIVNGTLIEIRGFLYRSADSKKVLAAEPNLKSCCIGSTSKRHRQLLLEGNIDDMPDQYKPVTLQGNLFINLDDPFPFRLMNVKIATEERLSYGILLLIGSTLLFISMVTFFKMKGKLHR